MKIAVSMYISDEFMGIFNSRLEKFKEKIIDKRLKFFLEGNEKDYYYLTDLFREYRDKYRDSLWELERNAIDRYRIGLQADFTEEEYMESDLFYFSPEDIIFRNTTDMEKTYNYTVCPECWENTKIEQTASLFFSRQVFYPRVDPEEFDCQLTSRRSNTFSTDFGETLVSENVRRIMEENNVAKGVEFERVRFSRKRSPVIYQLKIKHRTGKYFSPWIKLAEGRTKCPVCGFFDNYVGLTTVFNAPIDSCPLTPGNWKNWANHIEPGDYPDDDMLLSEERLGDRMKKYRLVFISPRLRKVFIDNDIAFSSEPVVYV